MFKVRSALSDSNSKKDAELWRDPAILRIQPRYGRLMMAHAAFPMLGAIILMVTRYLDVKNIEPYLDSFLAAKLTVTVQGTVIKTTYSMPEVREALAIKIVCGACYLWSFSIAFHLSLLANWGLAPLFRRLRTVRFRSELAVAPLSSNHFLKSVLMPHLRVALSGSFVLALLGWIHIAYFEFKYLVVIPWLHTFHITYCLLNLCVYYWADAGEDFQDNYNASNVAPRLRWILWSSFMGLGLLLIAYLHFLAVEHKAYRLIPTLIGLMAVIIVLLMLDLRRLWKGMCQRFSQTE